MKSEMLLLLRVVTCGLLSKMSLVELIWSGVVEQVAEVDDALVAGVVAVPTLGTAVDTVCGPPVEVKGVVVVGGIAEEGCAVDPGASVFVLGVCVDGAGTSDDGPLVVDCPPVAVVGGIAEEGCAVDPGASAVVLGVCVVGAGTSDDGPLVVGVAVVGGIAEEGCAVDPGASAVVLGVCVVGAEVDGGSDEGLWLVGDPVTGGVVGAAGGSGASSMLDASTCGKQRCPYPPAVHGQNPLHANGGLAVERFVYEAKQSTTSVQTPHDTAVLFAGTPTPDTTLPARVLHRK